MLKKVVEDIIFWLFLYTGLGENQVILLYVGFLLFSVFTLNIMLARGTFVDDLYQIEGIFLYILFAAIQVIILVPPLPPLESLFIFLSYTVIFYFLIFYSVFL